MKILIVNDDGFDAVALPIQVGAPVPRDGVDLTVDMDAVLNGYISVTPMAWRRMDPIAYEAIKDIAE